jgi:esterase/lipase superfamily enzyme
MLALVSVFAQVDPRLTRRPFVPLEARLSEGEQALVRARAATNKQNVAQAYAEYGAALRLVPRTGPQRDEALRGYSESGVKLAQQRLKEGRAPEAERIAREVLSANPGYRPALALLASVSRVEKAPPLVGSAPPLTVPRALDRRNRSGFAVTPAPAATAAPRMASRAPATAPSQPPRQATAPKQPKTQVEDIPADMPEEAPAPPPPEGEPPPPPPPRRQQQQQQVQATPAVSVKQPLVKVFFATDRRPSGAKGPSNYFGSEWYLEEDNLYTGSVTVSIPPVHKEGKVERPFKWWIIEFSEDPKKHVVLTDLKVVKGNDFYGALRTEYDRRETEKRSALVFIHGFNVPFDQAAYNTAQIAYDLDFDGVPMMYSWPSQGSVLAYDGDQEAAEWSAPHLQTFLERMARESGALRIHIIAHSMGNRPLSRALAAIGHQSDIQPLFDNIIMAAPDVNASTFTQLWPDIKNAAKRFTLYASSDDKALAASRKSKGGTNFARLGEGGPKIVVIPGIDTVDASGIDTSWLGHSYVDSCKPVMNDLQLLIAKGWAPLQRKLRDRQKEGLAYWAFP